MATRHLRDSWGGYRARLVQELRDSGINDLAVLEAFGETPRHLFTPDAVKHRAYENCPLPIGCGQTISQPAVQAIYLQALQLKGTEKALEIGTGSGYQTALLARLADSVVSVERLPELAESARKALGDAGILGISIVVADGTLGWRPLAPYDAILVSAASPGVPQPLLDQLTEGGRLVIPVSKGRGQELLRISHYKGEFKEDWLGSVRFVPLIGKYGYGPEAED